MNITLELRNFGISEQVTRTFTDDHSPDLVNYLDLLPMKRGPAMRLCILTAQLKPTMARFCTTSTMDLFETVQEDQALMLLDVEHQLRGRLLLVGCGGAFQPDLQVAEEVLGFVVVVEGVDEDAVWRRKWGRFVTCLILISRQVGNLPHVQQLVQKPLGNRCLARSAHSDECTNTAATCGVRFQLAIIYARRLEAYAAATPPVANLVKLGPMLPIASAEQGVDEIVGLIALRSSGHGDCHVNEYQSDRPSTVSQYTDSQTAMHVKAVSGQLTNG